MGARWLAGPGLRALMVPLMMAGVLIGLGQGQALASTRVNSTLVLHHVWSQHERLFHS